MRRGASPSLRTVIFAAAIANGILVCCLVLSLVAKTDADDFRSKSARQREELTIITLQNEVSRLRQDLDDAQAHVLAAQAEPKRDGTPRELSIYLESDMVQKLRPFSKTWFDVFVDPAPEPEALAVRITNVLRFSGWQASIDTRVDDGKDDIRLANGVIARSVLGLKGLNISISGAKKAEWQPAMDALCGELRKAVPAATCSPKSDTPLGDYAVHISVGR
jgi:hypothetical protein